jgi:hypothetical protein
VGKCKRCIVHASAQALGEQKGFTREKKLKIWNGEIKEAIMGKQTADLR